MMLRALVARLCFVSKISVIKFNTVIHHKAICILKRMYDCVRTRSSDGSCTRFARDSVIQFKMVQLQGLLDVFCHRRSLLPFDVDMVFANMQSTTHTSNMLTKGIVRVFFYI